jgi:predicted nucleotidyltransferase component of viral defense system
LFNADRQFYLSLSERTGFHKDVIEKVHRLVTILEFINTNAFLRDRLVLKGGTALNLTIFNLPRLSVDIDLDFHSEADRDTVLREREEVRRLLSGYLEREGYRILPKSKNYFALESIVAGYANNAGNLDNIKIEINYLLRHHVFPIVKRQINTEVFGETGEVATIDGIEWLPKPPPYITGWRPGTFMIFTMSAGMEYYQMNNTISIVIVLFFTAR